MSCSRRVSLKKLFSLSLEGITVNVVYLETLSILKLFFVHFGRIYFALFFLDLEMYLETFTICSPVLNNVWLLWLVQT